MNLLQLGQYSQSEIRCYVKLVENAEFVRVTQASFVDDVLPHAQYVVYAYDNAVAFL